MDVLAGLRRVFTGDRQRERPPSDSVTLRDARQAFGSWRGVAQAMGVSERTLRRARNEGRVSERTRGLLGALGRQGDVRRAAVRPQAGRRAARMMGTGARVRIDGEQGPGGFGRRTGRDYKRSRTIEFDLSPQQYSDIQNAYLDGDDERASQLLGDAAQIDYGQGRILGEGWDFGDLREIEMMEPGE